jgi:hypothetical protein
MWENCANFIETASPARLARRPELRSSEGWVGGES